MKRLLPLLALGLLVPTVGAEEVKKNETYQVPFRLTIPKHILVRAKINGKGPFNFILDTGAPALFLSEEAAKKAGVKADDKGWGTPDRFEIEGGVVVPKAKARVETIFQLKGMNGLGLAGCELHGVIGYNILAQYRMEIDFTKDKMHWTKLDFMPKGPAGLGGKGGGGAGGLELVGAVMEFLGGFLGRKAEPTYAYQPFFGFELSEKEDDVIVKKVLENSPAEKAGVKAGDVFVKFNGRSVYGLDGLRPFTKKVEAGEKVELIMKRDGKEITLTLQPGEGL